MAGHVDHHKNYTGERDMAVAEELESDNWRGFELPVTHKGRGRLQILFFFFCQRCPKENWFDLYKKRYTFHQIILVLKAISCVYISLEYFLMKCRAVLQMTKM